MVSKKLMEIVWNQQNEYDRVELVTKNREWNGTSIWNDDDKNQK